MTESMSDEEIRENLLNLGQNIGPVVDSTRAFYRRKLAKLLGEIKDEPVAQSSDAEGSASETETHEEKEDLVQEELFSQSYTPPAEIRGRRSIHTNAEAERTINIYADRPPPRHSHAFNSSNNGETDIRNIASLVLVFGLIILMACIIYISIFTDILPKVQFGQGNLHSKNQFF